MTICNLYWIFHSHRWASVYHWWDTERHTHLRLWEFSTELPFLLLMLDMMSQKWCNLLFGFLYLFTEGREIKYNMSIFSLLESKQVNKNRKQIKGKHLRLELLDGVVKSSTMTALAAFSTDVQDSACLGLWETSINRTPLNKLALRLKTWRSVMRDLLVILNPEGRRKSSRFTKQFWRQHSMTHECMRQVIPTAKHCMYLTVRKYVYANNSISCDSGELWKK